METVTVSPKFLVVIPLSIRRELDLKPGMKLQVFRHEDRVEFIPLKSIKAMRGFLKGIDTAIEREDNRFRVLSIHRVGSSILPTRIVRTFSPRRSKIPRS